MKTIAFLFGYGSEVRQFIFSGLIPALAAEARVIVYSRVFSYQLVCLSKMHRFELRNLESGGPGRFEKRFFSLCDKIFFSRIKPEGKFSYFGPAEKAVHSASRSLTGVWPHVLRLLTRVESCVFLAGALLGPERRQLAHDKVDAVVFNLPRSPFFLRYPYAAALTGTKAVLVFHTMKEIDANGRFAAPVDKYLVWDAAFGARLREFNPHVRNEDICPHGSLYYGFQYTPKSISIDELFESLGLGTRKYFLYCAGNPAAFHNEHLFVKQLHSVLQADPKFREYGLVVRTNPMDDKPDRWRLNLDKYAVDVPKWVWLPEENWNEATAEDVARYWTLLRSAVCVLGGASTVTLDSLVAQRPVLNFSQNLKDAHAGYELPFGYFWSAKFYEALREIPGVSGVDSLEEFVPALRRAAAMPVAFDVNTYCGCSFSGGSVSFVKNTIMEML